MDEATLREKIAQEIEAVYLKEFDKYPEIEGTSQMPKDLRIAYRTAILIARGKYEQSS